MRSPEGAAAGSQLEHLPAGRAAGTTPNTGNEKDSEEAAIDFTMERGATESIMATLTRWDATALRMEGLSLKIELRGRQLDSAL